MRLFDELAPLHGFGAPERELIEYAALLHDIGWHIGRNGHHKHSMYLILNGDLKSFSRRGGRDHREHRALPPQGAAEAEARGVRGALAAGAADRRRRRRAAAAGRRAGPQPRQRGHRTCVAGSATNEVKCVVDGHAPTPSWKSGAPARKRELFEKVFKRDDRVRGWRRGRTIDSWTRSRQPHNFPGKLIIVEGIDGSGKSTQLQLAKRYLAGARAASRSSPSGTAPTW